MMNQTYWDLGRKQQYEVWEKTSCLIFNNSEAFIWAFCPPSYKEDFDVLEMAQSCKADQSAEKMHQQMKHAEKSLSAMGEEAKRSQTKKSKNH